MKKLLFLLGVLCMCLAIISSSITIAIKFKPLFLYDVKKFDLPNTVGLSYDKVVKNYDELMEYLNNKNISTLSMSDFKSSKEGLIHFEEVKKLFHLNYFINIVSLILSFIFLMYLFRNGLTNKLKKPLIVIFLCPIILVSILLLNFDKAFNLFHGVFFRNDYWLFDPNLDPIINILPQEFFMHSFILIIVLIEVFTLSLLILTKVLKRK